MPPELVGVLRAYQQAQEREQATAADMWLDHGVVFAQANGRPPEPRADWQEDAE